MFCDKNYIAKNNNPLHREAKKKYTMEITE